MLLLPQKLDEVFKMKLGGIEVLEQKELASMPQEAASAWSATMEQPPELCGAPTYKPVAYVGPQIVKGTNYIFIAQQTLVFARPERHIVLVTINAFDGKYQTVSIEPVI